MGEDRSETSQRFTVPEAAEILGLTVEAVRGRIKRKKLRSTKEGGTVYVHLDTDQIPTGQTGQQPDEDQTAAPGPELVEVLKDQLAYMREQLAAERRANEENRRIIAALTQRIPEIEAPRGEDSSPSQEARESPESATEQPGRVEPQPAVGGAQEPRESHEMAMRETGGGPLPHDQQTPSARPWWRRWFGG